TVLLQKVSLEFRDVVDILMLVGAHSQVDSCLEILMCGKVFPGGRYQLATAIPGSSYANRTEQTGTVKKRIGSKHPAIRITAQCPVIRHPVFAFDERDDLFFDKG